MESSYQVIFQNMATMFVMAKDAEEAAKFAVGSIRSIVRGDLPEHDRSKVIAVIPMSGRQRQTYEKAISLQAEELDSWRGLSS